MGVLYRSISTRWPVSAWFSTSASVDRRLRTLTVGGGPSADMPQLNNAYTFLQHLRTLCLFEAKNTNPVSLIDARDGRPPEHNLMLFKKGLT